MVFNRIGQYQKIIHTDKLNDQAFTLQKAQIIKIENNVSSTS